MPVHWSAFFSNQLFEIHNRMVIGYVFVKCEISILFSSSLIPNTDSVATLSPDTGTYM